MTQLHRIRVPWTGFVGGSGISTFFFDAATTDMTPLKTFLNTINVYLPNTVTLNIPTIGDNIEDTDGSLQGTWTVTGGSGNLNSAGGTTGYSGVSGFCVDWATNITRHGHRVMGKTFFVPASQNLYQSDGTIVDNNRTTIINAATAMIGTFSNAMKVWARPFAGRPATIGPPPRPEIPARPGLGCTVSGAKVPDKAIILRSRRD